MSSAPLRRAAPALVCALCAVAVGGWLCGAAAGTPRWSGFPSSLVAVAFSPDGSTLATGGEDGAVRLWHVATSQVQGHPLGGGIGRVADLAYARDGRTLAVAYSDGVVRLWDTRTQQQTGVPLRIPGGSSVGISLAFTRSGRLVTATTEVRIWDAKAARQIGASLGPANGFVAVSPDGQTIAAGDRAGDVRFWDSRSRKQLGHALSVDDGQRSEVGSFAFSADGRRIAVVDALGVSMWDVRTGAQLLAPFGTTQLNPEALAFSPDGRTLAAVDFGQITLRDLVSTKTVVIRDNGDARSIAFSRDGRTIAAVGFHGIVRRWNLDTRRPVGKPLIAYPNPYGLAAFSPDGHTVAASDANGTLWLWDTRSAQPLGRQLEFANDAEAIAFCGGPAEPCGDDTITSIRFNTDGSTVTAVNDWPSTSTWDTTTAQQLGETTILDDSGDYGRGAFVAASADGKVTAEALMPWLDPPANAIFWQYAGSAPVPAPGVQDYDYDVNAVALSPDGQILAVAGPALWLWDTVGRQQMAANWAGREPFVYYTSLAFTPVGQTLLAGASDGNVRFWNPWTLRQIATPLQASPNNQPITSIAFSPDGTTFATASADWTIRLWNSQTHAEIGPPLRDDGPVNSVAYSPDGKRLVSAGLAGLRLWNLTASNPVR